MTLARGKGCAPVDRSDVKILDTSKKTFHAIIKRKMKCGEAEDELIDLEAVILDR